ncbi:MAG TPA: helix-turn-helix transcriptional regulator [Egibacteraceae bacterium]|nr:helix-turn-helix transcriptional regulator [Egibacteraceae bacterium]
MSGYAKGRGRDRIAELAGRGMDLVSFWQECTDALAPAVPHYLGPCWFTLDPASLLVTSHFQEGLAEIPHEWLAQQYYADDYNKMADVARSDRGVATLHEATGGNPQLSARYRDVMAPYGGEQEMIAGLRTPTGEIWGALGLYREKDTALFDASDLDFVRAIAPSLAEGARRALLLGEATDPEDPHGPGLLVLTQHWEIESMTAGVEQWLAELPDGDWEHGQLPSAVAAVAGQALRSTAGAETPGEVAFARVLTRAGRWILLHGAALESGRSPRAAVIIEPAHPARLMPLLMAAYELTDRERDVTRLVLQGRSTTEIAASLFISPHTVQQHLTKVFAKTGVRSRRDLVGKIFFAHYEPRVRDNEQRVVRGQPLRGGPVSEAPPRTATGSP